MNSNCITNKTWTHLGRVFCQHYQIYQLLCSDLHQFPLVWQIMYLELIMEVVITMISMQKVTFSSSFTCCLISSECLDLHSLLDLEGGKMQEKDCTK